MAKRLPGLTEAEAEVLERYARALELLARINPARTGSAVAGCVQSAAALAAEAKALHRAFATMQVRGESELFGSVLTPVLRHLEVDRHIARLGLRNNGGKLSRGAVAFPWSCQQRESMVLVVHASATFTVTDFAPAGVLSSSIETALPVSVATMTKQFDGEIRGRSATVFTAAFDQITITGTYLAMESFQGTVHGRSGSFNFAHSATTFGEGRRNELFVVVPKSGTDELAGISGSGAVAIDADGTHRIWLDYEFDR